MHFHALITQRGKELMVVQHNLSGMNANRQLGITTGIQAKSSEKLSSGYKINRAADDAAGLDISEKMRRQIRGLTQASANAQDGISLVQIADGGILTLLHQALQRGEIGIRLELLKQHSVGQDLDACVDISCVIEAHLVGAVVLRKTF